MKDKAQKKAWEKIIRNLQVNREKIKPIATQGLFNFRCHENCVEYIRLNPDKNYSIAETIYVDEDTPILHYVIFDQDENQYLEVTLGWRIDTVDTYLLRVIPKDDNLKILSIFSDTLDIWLNEFTSWFDRKILKIDRVL